MLIDTHCHLNDPKAFPNPSEAVRRAVEAGVGRMVVVGVDQDSCLAAISLAEAHDEVYALVGRHPNYTAGYRTEDLEQIKQMLGHPKVVGLGEIGLDYHWDYSPREQQWVALRDQLALARELDVPVVFHCREAYHELLTYLESQPPARYLVHCFLGSGEDARRAIALGCLIGVDGPVTYRKSHVLREVLGGVPDERLVLETDSPYLSPEPLRGKSNEPANLPLIARALAQTRGTSESEIAYATTKNAERFFRLQLAN